MLQELYNKAKAGDVDEPYQEVCNSMRECRLENYERDTAGWIIFYYLKYRLSAIPSLESRKALKRYLDLDTEKPSLLHTQILNQAIRLSDENSDFKLLQFVSLWGTQYLTDQSLKENLYNGKSYPSIYEKIVTHSYMQDNSPSAIIDVLGKDHLPELQTWISKQAYFQLYQASKEEDKSKESICLERYLDGVEGLGFSNEWHSKILNTILWSLKEDNIWMFKEWFEKWGINSLVDGDWRKNVKDGKEYASLAEKAISKYIEACKRSSKPIPEEFENLLKSALKREPCQESYVRALVHIDVQNGNRESAIERMKNIILTSAKYYLWADLGEIVEDKDLQAGCLCKALLLQKDDDFTGKIRLRLASLLIEKGDLASASYELKKYQECYEKNGWRINQKVEDMQGAVGDVVIPQSNKKLYDRYAVVAEQFVYSDLPTVHMVLIDKSERTIDGKTKIRFRFIDQNRMTIDCNPKKFGLPLNTSFMRVFDVKMVEVDGRKLVVQVNTSDMAPETVLSYKCAVVDNVNPEKHLFHCVVDSTVNGIVPTRDLKVIPQKGDLIDVFYLELPAKDGKQTRFKIIDFKPHSGENILLKRNISGPVRIKTKPDGKVYGFVGDQYVHDKFLSGINDGDNLSCVVIFDGNRWNVLRLEKLN